ncbi:DUF58 domain-containing protein [Salicola sp. Rm-C-2C1-2]|uniref:DUF58 domain-containing protein n=1 Tax=Salicola sp. Rm-C-2C1-2 TaxID=3141321 RepID=UPI0032E40BD5
MFTGVLLISLLTGINYQNSLIYLFTFILGALFYGTIFQTYRNIEGLHLSLVRAGEAEAGNSLPVAIRITDEDHRSRSALRLQIDAEAPVMVTVEAGEGRVVLLPVATRRRGLRQTPSIRLETDFPFGLIKAWTWFRPASRGLVTPRPVTPPPLEVSPDVVGEEGEVTLNASPGDSDIRLRPYRQGDSPRRISWKRFVRNGQLVVMDWDTPPADPRWLDWAQFPGVDTELRLSYLAWQVERLSEQGQPFGLRLPGQTLEPDSGDHHERACLTLLGTFGFDEARA